MYNILDIMIVLFDTVLFNVFYYIKKKNTYSINSIVTLCLYFPTNSLTIDSYIGN